MRQRLRGWIMPETDMLSMLSLIEERVSSPEIEDRHRDILIRLRTILENDLNAWRSDDPYKERSSSKEIAA
jgi:hypothetical protein